MAIQVKAKYDYHSGHEDDLSFSAGQILNVTEEVDEEWYNGEYHDGNGTHHRGMFPRNFVTLNTPESSSERPVVHKKEERIPNQPDPVSKVTSPPKQAPVAAATTPAKAASLPPVQNTKGNARGSMREEHSSQPTVCPIESSTYQLTLCSFRLLVPLPPFSRNSRDPHPSVTE
jgi:myosin tail region-interacting protein MTI1